MSDLEQLLGLKPGAFAPNSRYASVQTATLTASDGRTIVYLRRRFVPPAASLHLLQLHSVVQGDRLDNLSAAYYGDPELFWRIADANEAFDPDELTAETGRTLRVTLPQGMSGPVV
jgi:nucleoid-associated protein YgaU